MFDPVVIAALIISIASAIFVAIKEGVGLTLEYRESETTSKRKKEIDRELIDEVKKELKNLLESDIPTKQNDEQKVFESIEELGHCAFLARSLTGKMLDDIKSYIKMTFKNLAGALVVLFLTLTLGISFWVPLWDSPSMWFLVLFLTIYGVSTLALFVWSINNLKRYYYIREKFLRLHENPTLKYCKELEKELNEKGLW